MAVNIHTSTHNRASNPRDENGDSFEDNPRRTPNMTDRLMMIVDTWGKRFLGAYHYRTKACMSIISWLWVSCYTS